jgi:hypothetical protein
MQTTNAEAFLYMSQSNKKAKQEEGQLLAEQESNPILFSFMERFLRGGSKRKQLFGFSWWFNEIVLSALWTSRLKRQKKYLHQGMQMMGNQQVRIATKLGQDVAKKLRVAATHVEMLL